MATYGQNFGNFTANWAGIDIKSGLDSGMPLSAVRTGPVNTIKPTGSGSIIKIKQTDNSGVITCTVDYSSPAYTLLIAQLKLETLDMFTVYDGNTQRRWYYKNAFLFNIPDLSIGIDTAPFSFTWYFEDQDYQVAANANLNVLGG